MSWAEGIISAVAGGMQGGGTAWQTQARDEEQAKRVAALETLRSKNDLDRQTALEAIRATNTTANTRLAHQLGQESALSRVQGPLAEATIANDLAKAQAAFDQQNNPANVATTIATQGRIDDNKIREMAPGSQMFRGGAVIAENTRQTGAEANAELYRQGLKHGAGSGNPPKLDPHYEITLKQLNSQEEDIGKSIRDLNTKRLTDVSIDQKGGEKALLELQQQQAGIQAQRRRLQIESGLVDPDRTAAALAPAIKSLDDLNAHLRAATKDGGPAWSNRVADAFQRAGVPQKFDKKSTPEGAALSESLKTGDPVNVLDGGIIGRAMKGGDVSGRGDTVTSNDLITTNAYSQSLFDKETKEIEQGIRFDYSEEVKKELRAQQASSPRTGRENEDYLKRERELQMRLARENRGR